MTGADLDIQSTTYPIAGFLVPGFFCLVVLVLPILLNWAPDPGALFRLVKGEPWQNQEKGWLAFLLGCLAILLTATAFVAGTMFSDSFFTLYRLIFKDAMHYLYGELNMHDILGNSPSLGSILDYTGGPPTLHGGSYIREAYVLTHNGGINLYWWISRARMLGACGLELFVGFVMCALPRSWFLPWCPVTLRPPEKLDVRPRRRVWSACAVYFLLSFSVLFVASYRYYIFYEFLKGQAAVQFREKEFDAEVQIKSRQAPEGGAASGAKGEP